MQAVAVRALADEHFHGRHGGGIADDRQHAPAQIAGEPDAPHHAVVRHFHLQLRRTDDVPRVVEPHAQSRHGLEPLAVILAAKDLHAGDGVCLGVERPIACNFGFLQVLAEILLILLLDVSAVPEHHRGEILGGVRAVHGAAVPALEEQRDPPHVVHVRMAQHERIDIRGLEREGVVLHRGLRAPALEEPAIQQHALGTLGPVELEFVAGAGHFLGGSVGDEFHMETRLQATDTAVSLMPGLFPGGHWPH